MTDDMNKTIDHHLHSDDQHMHHEMGMQHNQHENMNQETPSAHGDHQP